MYLATDEIHLWQVFDDRLPETALADCLGLLDAEEYARHRRFRHRGAQRQHLIARALVRTTLSRYAEPAPRDWRFIRNAYGRPEIADPDVDLRFNVSHSEGLIVCAVARRREIGVDVEHRQRRGRMADIAERFFSAREAAALRALPEARQQQRFFDYWTLKEAYIKARGMGLALPLGGFSFHLDAGAIRISFEGLDDDPARWHFWLLQPSASHALALCGERRAGQRLRLKRLVAAPGDLK